jgi:hypothetical protein
MAERHGGHRLRRTKVFPLQGSRRRPLPLWLTSLATRGKHTQAPPVEGAHEKQGSNYHPIPVRVVDR